MYLRTLSGVTYVGNWKIVDKIDVEYWKNGPWTCVYSKSVKEGNAIDNNKNSFPFLFDSNILEVSFLALPKGAIVGLL